MIIGLSGYARSGKDEIAKVLVEELGFTRVAFADPIRNMLLEVNPYLEKNVRLVDVVAEYGWDVAKAMPEVRRLLQATGVSARTHISPTVWIDAALRNKNVKDIVVTDVRFRNEATVLRSMRDSKIWRVDRPGIEAVNNHVSEHDLDDWTFDEVIFNNGTLDDLRSLVKSHMVLL